MAQDRALPRRTFLNLSAAGLAGLSLNEPAQAQQGQQPAQPQNQQPTRFIIACMTLPYSAFPLQRSLEGLRKAGYHHVAWGTSHLEANGKRVPILAPEAPPKQAAELATRCRDMGLEPVMMFSGIYPEAKTGLEVLRSRLLQAAAAKIPQVLTFGHTRGGNDKLWIERFKQLAPIARDNNVLLVVKQHGGETGTGEACARITREVNHDFIKVNYDAGNVLDYLRGKINPLTDLEACASEVRSFCIKDHRFSPTDQDCGPGLGEIDHYRLLNLVAFTGRTIPLCCENISAPGIRPTTPEEVDFLARRAREFLELVIACLHRPRK